MEDRSVAVEVALTEGEEIPDLESKLETLRVAIADRGGVPLLTQDRRRYGARFSVSGSEADAVAEGVEVFRDAAASAGLPDAPVVDVEASTLAELVDVEADGGVPELIGITELAELLGVEHELVTVLARAKGFPSPVAELNAGPVWTLVSIDRFLRRAQADPDAVESSTRPG